MPLTMTMPGGARRVARQIRDKAPRPIELPKPAGGRWFLRWGGKSPLSSCPMGMLPNARTPAPADIGGFTMPFPVNDGDVTMFACWWDTQDDPEAAVAAVWDEPLED